MNLTLFKFLGALIYLVLSLIFGFLPLKLKSFRSNKRLLSFSNCFAAGLFISIGFLHILPEANNLLKSEDEEEIDTHDGHADEDDHDHEAFPLAFGICLISFCFILFVDKVLFNHEKSEDEIDSKNKKKSNENQE